jgi:hypothetical protein
MFVGPPVLSCELQSRTAQRGNHGQLTSVGPPVLCFSTTAIQLTAPIGDDSQRMSFGPPVLWYNAVQLAAPVGDNGQ